MGKTIGNNIKSFRKNKGFTQEELADLLSVTPQAVSKWESENSLPDVSMLIPLAQVLGVSTDALLGYDSLSENEAVIARVRETVAGMDSSDEGRAQRALRISEYLSTETALNPGCFEIIKDFAEETANLSMYADPVLEGAFPDDMDRIEKLYKDAIRKGAYLIGHCTDKVLIDQTHYALAWIYMLTPEAFNELTSRLHYNYSFLYDVKPDGKVAQADYSENFLKALITQTLVDDNEIEDYLPTYLSQARNFAPSDIEGDSVGTAIFCYILIAVIAFIFAITISNTIDKEASVIGTLRASGYSKGELIVHYMSMPVIVTLAGAAIGNALGYTVFRDMAIKLYFNTYSLPLPEVVWSPSALVKTTVIPLLLMFFINLFVIVKKLQLSPLKFLRHDLTKSRRTKARRIPAWSFLSRFRLRVLFQNMPNYAVLIFGVILSELMLCFGFGIIDSLENYGDRAPEMVFAEYQYMLMGYKDEDGNVIVTDEESAERFSCTNLLYPKEKTSMREGMGSGGDESVTIYGISDGSAYIDLASDIPEGHVYISSAFGNKFYIKAGDVITLHEEYENKSYEFTVDGIVDYEGGIAV